MEKPHVPMPEKLKLAPGEEPSIFCGTPAEEREAGEDADNFDMASTVAGSSGVSSWSPWDPGSAKRVRGATASPSQQTITSSERLSFATDASAWSPKEARGKPW